MCKTANVERRSFASYKKEFTNIERWVPPWLPAHEAEEEFLSEYPVRWFLGEHPTHGRVLVTVPRQSNWYANRAKTKKAADELYFQTQEEFFASPLRLFWLFQGIFEDLQRKKLGPKPSQQPWLDFIPCLVEYSEGDHGYNYLSEQYISGLPIEVYTALKNPTWDTRLGLVAVIANQISTLHKIGISFCPISRDQMIVTPERGRRPHQVFFAYRVLPTSLRSGEYYNEGENLIYCGRQDMNALDRLVEELVYEFEDQMSGAVFKWFAELLHHLEKGKLTAQDVGEALLAIREVKIDSVDVPKAIMRKVK
jgi:hypothetical protein